MAENETPIFHPHGHGLFGQALQPERNDGPLAARFIVPPFSVLNAREGAWQDRKRAWLALGIQSELGRGGQAGEKLTMSERLKPSADQAGKRKVCPGGSPRPACDYRNKQRGDGRGRALGAT